MEYYCETWFGNLALKHQAKPSLAWYHKCNIVNVNMCNLQLIHTIQQAKCYYNTVVTA